MKRILGRLLAALVAREVRREHRRGELVSPCPGRSCDFPYAYVCSCGTIVDALELGWLEGHWAGHLDEEAAALIARATDRGAS